MMKKRITGFLLSALMLVSLLPTAAWATSPTVSSWEKLSTAMSYADPVTAGTELTVDLGSTPLFTVKDDSGIRTVKLLADINADADDEVLAVPSGDSIVLDLNGHTVNRGLSIAAAKSKATPLPTRAAAFTRTATTSTRTSSAARYPATRRSRSAAACAAICPLPSAATSK